MIIVAYMGGLGNQMFIYAMQTLLEEIYPDQEIKADIHHYNLLNEHNGFELTKYFDVNLNYAELKESRQLFDGQLFPDFFSQLMISKKTRWIIASKGQSLYMRVKMRLSKTSRTIRDLPGMGLNTQIYDLKEGDWFLYGLWQNIDYYKNYKDLIRKKLSFKVTLTNENDMNILEKLKSGELIAIHIRGGDFRQPKYQICDTDYYKKACSFYGKNPRLCVFTDDEEYAREIIPSFQIDYVVSHGINQSVLDMYMMSRARKVIISNSTFAFWSGFLSPYSDCSIVAPYYSYYENEKYVTFPQIDGWHYIKNGSHE